MLGGELKFEFFHRWFNSLFLASVALTLLLLYGCARQPLPPPSVLPKPRAELALREP